MYREAILRLFRLEGTSDTYMISQGSYSLGVTARLS